MFWPLNVNNSITAIMFILNPTRLDTNIMRYESLLPFFRRVIALAIEHMKQTDIIDQSNDRIHMTGWIILYRAS